MSTQTSFPIFEDNQVLTSSQLNDMRIYLDEQNRLTRTRLIGIGVADGMNVGFDSVSKQISISCGTGVTSAGYLITLGECALDRYRNYTLPLGSFYEPFLNEITGLQDVTLYELLSVGSTPGIGETALSSLPSSFFNDKAVMLFIELADIDNDSCLGRKCDENGISRMFTLRKLLVSKLDLDKIISRLPVGIGDPMNEEKYGLPVISMRRPLFDAALSNSTNYMDFSINYAASFRTDVFPGLIAELNNTYDVYSSFLQPVYGSNPFQDAGVLFQISEWTSYLNGTQATTAPPYFGIQYFYDFTKDLILAYDEFCETAFEIASECCINMSRFERHLMLGEVIPTSTCGPTPYRQEFIFSRVQEGQRMLFDKAIMLHKRIVLMIKSFEFDLVRNPDAANILQFITPSFEKRSYLSDRALPYYYNINSNFAVSLTGGSSTLAKNWNYDLNRKCRVVNGIPQLLAYDNQDADQLQDQTPIKTPLYYNLDSSNFFRIEGHLRKNYVEVLDELEFYKNRFDLPFNIVALRLQGEPFDVVEDRCNFEDLRSQYSVLRSSFICNTSFICNLVTKQVNSGSFIAHLYEDMNASVGNPSVAFNPSVATTVTIGAALSPAVLQELELSFPGITTTLNGTSFDAVNSSGIVSAEKTVSETVVVGRSVSGKAVEQVSVNELFTINDPANLQVDPGTVIIDRSSPLEVLIADYHKFMSDLCTKLTALTAEHLLPFDFKSFTFGADITLPADSFITTYKEAVSLAISSKVALNKIEDLILRNTKKRPTPELYYLLSRYFGEVYNVLNTFILNCAYKEFEMLYYTYRYRVNWLRENDPTLFSNFIKKHPGLEHKAGVQPGGTFIILYNGDNITLNVQAIEEAIQISQNFETLRCREAELLDLSTRTIGQSMELQLIQTQLTECLTVTNALANNVPISIQQIQLEEHQVIADFALPYLCCCDCDCSSIPAPSLSDLSLPTNYTMPVFVEYNMGDYAFGTAITESMEGCKTTVGFITIDVKGKVIYNNTAGTAFRIKIVKDGVPRGYDLTPDSNGVLDSITTSHGGTLQVVTETGGTIYTRSHSLKYRPAQNYVGVDVVDYIFETYDRFGKKLASTPGKLYIHITCDCTVVPIQNQAESAQNTETA